MCPLEHSYNMEGYECKVCPGITDFENMWGKWQTGRKNCRSTFVLTGFTILGRFNIFLYKHLVNINVTFFLALHEEFMIKILKRKKNICCAIT